MALDFGYNGETKPYIKFDARVGILKVKLNKEEEPQLKYPVRFAADIANTRQLHLCFPSDGPPRRLYFDNGVGAANIPPALSEAICTHQPTRRAACSPCNGGASARR